jgi:hypothetical protein
VLREISGDMEEDSHRIAVPLLLDITFYNTRFRQTHLITLL